MQIAMRFDELDHLQALKLAQLMCDLQHLAIALTSYPIDPDRQKTGIDLTQPFDPKYEEMIVGNCKDSPMRPFLWTPAKIVCIKKESPLDLTLAIFCTAGGAASVAAIAKLACRIILDMQKIRKEGVSIQRERLKLLKERLNLEKDYIKIKRQLRTKEERETLDSNMAIAMISLIDGRHDEVVRMKFIEKPNQE
jgi:hypothetical protein